MASEVPRCQQRGCKGLVKPGIVFFGEGLPKVFFDRIPDLSRDCDLLIVCGTSLKVQPFASLIDRVAADCPRLLVNKEVVGEAEYPGAKKGFDFERKAEYGVSDVLFQGDSDTAVWNLAKELGWEVSQLPLLSRSSFLARADLPLVPRIDRAQDDDRQVARGSEGELGTQGGAQERDGQGRRHPRRTIGSSLDLRPVDGHFTFPIP